MSTQTDDTAAEQPRTTTTQHGYRVPPDSEPVVCAFCGAPFRTDEFRTLHMGLEHAESLDDEQLSAFEDVYAAETEDVKLFRLKALGVLALLYFGFLMAYSLFA
ncbi:MAG: C2H2-type zinc finger protein [Halorientalis sp.]